MRKTLKILSGYKENWQALANAVREDVDIIPPKESIFRQEIRHLTSHADGKGPGPKEKDREQKIFSFLL